MTFLILYFLIALVFSFFCSIAEAVLLSVRPTFVAALERGNARGVASLKTLKSNLDRPLAAILSLNTVAHTVGAVGVGAEAAALYGSQYVGVASAIMTLLILVVSEIIPKSLGATYWPRLALPLAPAIVGLTHVLAPFVWLAGKITKLFGKGHGSAFTFSRDEFEAMAEIGVREGAIDEGELRIVTNLMRLEVLNVTEIMTPRAVIQTVPEDMTVQAFYHDVAKVTPFSRLPIHADHPDEITGYILKSDLLIAQAGDQFNRRLKEFKRTLPALPHTLSVSDAFDHMVRGRMQIALLVDEYGTVKGLLTLEDILETLIGLEVTDELDTVEDMRVLARHRWHDRMTALGIDPDKFNNNNNR